MAKKISLELRRSGEEEEWWWTKNGDELKQTYPIKGLKNWRRRRRWRLNVNGEEEARWRREELKIEEARWRLTVTVSHRVWNEEWRRKEEEGKQEMNEVSMKTGLGLVI